MPSDLSVTRVGTSGSKFREFLGSKWPTANLLSSMLVASSSCDFEQISVLLHETLRALQVDITNKSNTNYVFDAALSRGGLTFKWFLAEVFQKRF
jgi:hypothetical protein